jgi:hypothetical protein
MEDNLPRPTSKKKNRFRIDIALLLGFFLLLVSFCAYMINTNLESVLEDEYGSSVVTHDYTYETSSQDDNG